MGGKREATGLRERWRGTSKLLLLLLAFTYISIIQGTDLDVVDFGIQTAHVRFFHLQQTSRLKIQSSGLSEFVACFSFFKWQILIKNMQKNHFHLITLQLAPITSRVA